MNEDELLKEAVKIIFEEESQKCPLASWDKALIDLLKQDTLPIICLIQFQFSEVAFEEVSEIKSGFEYFSTNILDQFKHFRAERRKETIKTILENEKEPSLDGFWSDLALDFWAKMCQIDQKKLQAALPKNFIEDKSSGPKVDQILKKKTKKKKFCEKFCGPFNTLINFIWGSHVQIVPPRRVVSIEEKFRVISFEKVLLPQADLKVKIKNLTLKQKTKKGLFKLYKLAIYSAGGKPPKPYQPTQEEILDDILIWALDFDQAQQRILAFKNNLIKKEIVS